MDPTKIAKVGGGVSGVGLIVFLIQQLMAIAGAQATVVEAVTTIKADVKSLKSENKVMRERMIEILAAQRYVDGKFDVPLHARLEAEAEVAEAEGGTEAKP